MCTSCRIRVGVVELLLLVDGWDHDDRAGHSGSGLSHRFGLLLAPPSSVIFPIGLVGDMSSSPCVVCILIILFCVYCETCDWSLSPLLLVIQI